VDSQGARQKRLADANTVGQKWKIFIRKEDKPMRASNAVQLERREKATIGITSDLNPSGVAEITTALRQLLGDVFALYLKTKNFHWHMSGRHFRDFHLLLDEQADQIFAMTDEVAERARKIGGTTLRSISDISRHQRLKDNNEDSVAPLDMLAELAADNRQLTQFLVQPTRFAIGTTMSPQPA
jgi:starvation-inducible DNA-binding protein